MLTVPHVLELFLQRCIRDTDLHACETLFNRSFPKVLEWRWNSLTQTLAWLLPLEGPLRATWNAERFLGGSSAEDHAEHKFQVLRLAIPSPMFWAYAHTMQHLQLGLDKLAFWAEGCGCHEGLGGPRNELVGTMREDAPQTAVWQALMPDRDLSGSEWASCPMRTKRAPELAVGRLKQRLDEVLCCLCLPYLTKPKKHRLAPRSGRISILVF